MDEELKRGIIFNQSNRERANEELKGVSIFNQSNSRTSVPGF